MKNINTKFFGKLSKILLILFIVTAISCGVSYAGSLTPSGSPAATSYTLGDIYAKLTNGTNAIETNHSLSTSTAPASTFHTLNEIYNAIPSSLSILASTTTVPVGINSVATTLNAIDTDLVANNIKSGTTIFGVVGSYAGPTLTWQSGFPGIDLDWDALHGCTAGSGCLDPRGDGTLLLGAKEYCRYVDADGITLDATIQDIWHLPTYTQLIDAGPIGDHPAGVFVATGYWSSTSYSSSVAIVVHEDVGDVGFTNKSISLPVKCVK